MRATDTAYTVARGVRYIAAIGMREGGSRVRHQVLRAQDRTTDYVRAEPMRALLMAAATGAILFAVVRMLGQRVASDRVGERMSSGH